MFALTRLIHFPFILGQVGLNLGKPTLSHLKTANKTAASYWDKVCIAYYHKVEHDSKVITILNCTDVEESKVQENGHVHKHILGKIQTKIKMMFTCKKCNTQNTKYFSRLAYEKGIVIVICDGCDGKHLIADNLDWFKDNGTNIEKILSDRGEQVKNREVLVSENRTEIDVPNTTRTS